MVARRLTWDQVRAQRMSRGHLTQPAPSDRVVDVVGDVAGIQAQMLGEAELAVCARVDGFSVTDVRRELWERRSLVKVWGPRGTLHLLPARELPVWMAALRAARADGAQPWREIEGMTRAQEAELAAATRDALDGRVLTRAELAVEVAARVGAWAHERLLSPWGDLLSPAALEGWLCFAPSRGPLATFARTDQWIGGWTDVDEIDALDTVVRRFLGAYGPSTAADVGRWVGCLPVTTERALARLAGQIGTVDVEGTSMVALTSEVDGRAMRADEAPGMHATNGARDVVRLLPRYDAFVMGSRPREQLIPAAVNARIRAYRRGKLEGAAALSTVLLDGRLVGIWERTVRARRVDIAVELVEPIPTRAQGALETEVARVGRALGLEPTLRLGILGPAG